MIRLAKGAIPEVLRRNAEVWTKELLAALQNDVAELKHWSRYRHEEVKRQLQEDAHDKCAYCESKMLRVSFGDIEHMQPKRRYPQRTYDWTNLSLACERCNNSKADKYDEDQPPIDPYEENPDRFLMAMGELIWSRPGEDRGTATIDLVKLNRPDLVEARRDRLESIRRLAEAAARAKGAARTAFLEQMEAEAGDEVEYAFVCRAVVERLREAIGAS